MLSPLKKEICSFALLAGTILLAQVTAAQESQRAILITPSTPEDSVYTSVQHMPEPPVKDINRYLLARLKYPKSAKKDNIEGRVLLSFIIGKDGKMRDLKIIKSLSPDCDQEALRLFNNISVWKPGMHYGKPVEVYNVYPVTFKRY